MTEFARLLSDAVAEVLRVFPGAKIVATDKPLFCVHCKKDYVPALRRGGKIIPRIEADGRHVWGCHYCGREAKRAEHGYPAAVLSSCNEPRRSGSDSR